MWKRTHNERTRGLLLTGLKAAGSAAVAIAVASAIHLQFSATAGIIAILSLMGTKRETMKVALGRLMAYGAALLIAFVCFSLFGDGLLAFGIYLFVFASLCYACSWGYATAMISVLISHFMGTGGMTWTQIGNESLLFLIGTTCTCTRTKGAWTHCFVRRMSRCGRRCVRLRKGRMRATP